VNTSRLERLLSRKRRGGTQVMVALMAPVLVGFTALTVDIGRLYVRKQALSNGVDASALAGGRELPNETAADKEARRVAGANGIDTTLVKTAFEHRGNGNGTPGSNGNGNGNANGQAKNYLRVTATEKVPMTFARIFGIQQWPVSAQAAVAVTGGGDTVNTIPSGSTPFGVDKSAIRADGGVSVVVHSCAFQQFWVLPYGNTPEAVKNMMINGNPNGVGVGDLLSVAHPADPNYWQSVLAAVDERTRRAQSNPTYSVQTPANATASNPRVVIVPLVEAANGGPDHKSTTQVKVIGFAAMYLMGIREVSVPNSGRQYFLDGKLVDIVTPDASHDPNRPNPDSGVTVRLRTGGGELDPLKLRLVE
jgi:Flp pilus assembly protein TadG